MFKLYKTMGREPFSERREATTGHDRFSNHHKIEVPRYRRRRNPNKRTQAETELAFELTSYSGDSSESPIYASGLDMCRSVSEIQWPNHNFGSSDFSDEPPPVCPPEPDHTMFLQTNCSDHVHEFSSRGFHHYPRNARPNSTSWGAISKFFLSVATTLTCRNYRKEGDKFNPLPRLDQSVRPTNYDYNRLGDESVAAEMVELQSPRDDMKLKTFPPHYGLIRSEKTAGHTACMNYLKNSNGRYVLLDQLPEIGWRTNRLWYVICDARVNAKRLLIATPCNSRSPVIDATTKNVMTQVCRALQHPYVCPVLDLETVTVENFDRPFSLVITPVAPRGSLRDVFHKSQWADHWPNKYCRRGYGLSEGHAQRLSCHILEAMLELRLRGLPAGIGGHLHPGNVLIQHGTARFSGLDNVLIGHNPRALPFISRYINTNLEAIDSISFAYILFAMCAGYEVVTAKLTPQNWNDIRDYVQASQVLEYILENPDSRVPTLKEISNLDFYRTIDLRELRSLPLPQVMAGPPVPSLTVLLEHLYSKKLQKGKKSRSTSEVCDTEKSSHCPFPGPPFESARGLHPRSFSLSTPSMSKTHTFSTDCLQGEAPSTREREGSASGSSQVSVYCTPPSSLNYSKPSTSTSTMEPTFTANGEGSNMKTI